MERLEEKKKPLLKRKLEIEQRAQELINNKMAIENELSQLNVELLRILGKLELIEELENG